MKNACKQYENHKATFCVVSAKYNNYDYRSYERTYYS